MTVQTVGIRRTRDGDLRMSAPYLPSFPSHARAIGGDFDKASKEWVFPIASTDSCTEQDVLDLMVSFYGTTGIDDPELCGVRVALGLHGSQRRGFFALGREIANRDKQGNFRLGHGVRHQSGALPERVRDDELIGENDAVIVVTDVPKGLAEREVRLYGDSMEIVDPQGSSESNIWTATPGAPLPSGRVDLGELRRKLLARLAEVQQAINAAAEEVA